MSDTLTQGSVGWIIEDDDTITEIGCVFDIDDIEDNKTEIDATCLGEKEAKQYEYGLVDNEVNVTFKFDKDGDGLKKVIALKNSGTEATFVIGLSDGTDDPTSSGGSISYPTTRSYIHFGFKVRDVPMTFEKDDLVTCEVPFRMTTQHTIELKQ